MTFTKKYEDEETLCEKCAHSKVCKHKDILAAVNERIDSLSISKTDGHLCTTVTMVRDIELVDIWATCKCFMHAVTQRGNETKLYF